MKLCSVLLLCSFFLIKSISCQTKNKTIVIHGPKIFDVDAKTAGTPLRVKRESSDVPDIATFNEFAKEQIAKSIYPRPTNFLDKTVDGKLLISHYGCEVGKPAGSSPFTPLTRSYKNCQIVKLEAKWDRSQSQGCNSNNKCSKTFKTSISTSETSSSSWSVGAQLSVLGLDISSERGASRDTSKTHENAIEDSVTLNPGEIGIPLVIVAGVKCDVELRAVLSGHVGKLNSDGFTSTGVVKCNKATCLLSCLDFLTGDFNLGDPHWFAIKKECLYYPGKKEIWPVTVPLEACKSKPDKVFEEKNVVMPLYGEDGKIVKISYIYVQA